MLEKISQNGSSLSLGGKISKSKDIIQSALDRFSGEEIRIAWTGGKDSTVMIWLFKELCAEKKLDMPRAMFINEGEVFDEIWAFVNGIGKLWHLEVDVVENRDVIDAAQSSGGVIQVSGLNARNRKEIEKLGYKENILEFDPESYVGNHLMKTVAMNMYLEDQGVAALATAIRWDEQEARINEDYFSTRDDPRHCRIHPILHFKERDIWNIIHEKCIPYCALYKEGYRSLGAKGSTTKTSSIPAWEQDLENTPERSGRGQDKEQVMTQLRALGYM